MNIKNESFLLISQYMGKSLTNWAHKDTSLGSILRIQVKEYISFQISTYFHEDQYNMVFELISHFTPIDSPIDTSTPIKLLNNWSFKPNKTGFSNLWKVYRNIIKEIELDIAQYKDSNNGHELKYLNQLPKLDKPMKH